MIASTIWLVFPWTVTNNDAHSSSLILWINNSMLRMFIPWRKWCITVLTNLFVKPMRCKRTKGTWSCNPLSVKCGSVDATVCPYSHWYRGDTSTTVCSTQWRSRDWRLWDWSVLQLLMDSVPEHVSKIHLFATCPWKCLMEQHIRENTWVSESGERLLEVGIGGEITTPRNTDGEWSLLSSILKKGKSGSYGYST